MGYFCGVGDFLLYTIGNMSTLLLIGIVMMSLPALLIAGCAIYIFLGFVNDDKDARAIFNLALLVMAIGFFFIVGHFVGTYVQIT